LTKNYYVWDQKLLYYRYDNESNEDVFGAVVNKASLMEDDPNKITDEFGLLSKIFYKNDLEGWL